MSCPLFVLNVNVTKLFKVEHRKVTIKTFSTSWMSVGSHLNSFILLTLLFHGILKMNIIFLRTLVFIIKAWYSFHLNLQRNGPQYYSLLNKVGFKRGGKFKKVKQVSTSHSPPASSRATAKPSQGINSVSIAIKLVFICC